MGKMRKFHYYNYIGIFNIIFILLATALSLLVSNGVDFRSHPISALGADIKGGIYFNGGLIMFAILQVFFALILCHKAKSGVVPKVFFVVGGLFLVLAGYFQYGIYTSLHNWFGTLCALFVATGIMMISRSLFKKSSLLQYFVYASLVSVIASFFLQDALLGARWEILMVIGITAWNVILSIPLIKHRA